jgi:K+-sensing histidine kinase KdpD
MENNNLLVDIRDLGNGIAPDDQERLFQPYHRVVQELQNILESVFIWRLANR